MSKYDRGAGRDDDRCGKQAKSNDTPSLGAAPRRRPRGLLRQGTQRAREIGRRREPIRRIDGQRALQHGAERRVGGNRRRKLDRLGGALRDHRRKPRARYMGRVAKRDLVQHASERVHIRPPVDGRAGHELLGAHVHRRSDDEPCRGAKVAERVRRHEGDAEIREDRALLDDENVLGLHVAVDDGVPVRHVESLRHVGEQMRAARHVESAPDQIAQAVAAHEGHDVVEQSLAFARIEHRDEGGMHQPGRDPHLAQKPRARVGRRVGGVEGLDRDEAIMAPIRCLEDGAHAAASHEITDGVSRAEGSIQPFAEVVCPTNLRRLPHRRDGIESTRVSSPTRDDARRQDRRRRARAAARLHSSGLRAQTLELYRRACSNRAYVGGVRRHRQELVRSDAAELSTISHSVDPRR